MQDTLSQVVVVEEGVLKAVALDPGTLPTHQPPYS